jgi:hypothetical protein
VEYDFDLFVGICWLNLGILGARPPRVLGISAFPLHVGERGTTKFNPAKSQSNQSQSVSKSRRAS